MYGSLLQCRGAWWSQLVQDCRFSGWIIVLTWFARYANLMLNHWLDINVYHNRSGKLWIGLYFLDYVHGCISKNRNLLLRTERLEKELHKLLPAYISEGIRVLPPPFGTDTAWFGAKMIGTVRTSLILVIYLSPLYFGWNFSDFRWALSLRHGV